MSQQTDLGSIIATQHSKLGLWNFLYNIPDKWIGLASWLIYFVFRLFCFSWLCPSPPPSPLPSAAWQTLDIQEQPLVYSFFSHHLTQASPTPICLVFSSSAWVFLVPLIILYMWSLDHSFGSLGYSSNSSNSDSWSCSLPLPSAHYNFLNTLHRYL